MFAPKSVRDLYFSWGGCESARGRCIVLWYMWYSEDKSCDTKHCIVLQLLIHTIVLWHRQDKVGDKTKHAIISIHQPRSPNTSLTSPRVLYEITTCTKPKSAAEIHRNIEFVQEICICQTKEILGWIARSPSRRFGAFIQSMYVFNFWGRICSHTADFILYASDKRKTNWQNLNKLLKQNKIKPQTWQLTSKSKSTSHVKELGISSTLHTGCTKQIDLFHMSYRIRISGLFH